jgi:hypothetical protein
MELSVYEKKVFQLADKIADNLNKILKKEHSDMEVVQHSLNKTGWFNKKFVLVAEESSSKLKIIKVVGCDKTNTCTVILNSRLKQYSSVEALIQTIKNTSEISFEYSYQDKL